jgi:hypothetical protein
VIPLSLLLALASLGLLVAGLLAAGQALVWGSLAASLAAGGCLVVAIRARREPPGATGGVPVGEVAAAPVDVAGLVADPTVPPPTAVDVPTAVDLPAGSELPGGPGAGASPARPADPATFPPGVSDLDEVRLPDRDGTTGAVEPAAAATSPPVMSPPAAPPPGPDDEPEVEDIPVPDALRVAQLSDPVLVVDGRPRYHLAECPRLAGRPSVPLPVSAARRAGFTPCAVCRPDATLLARSRSASGRSG